MRAILSFWLLLRFPVDCQAAIPTDAPRLKVLFFNYAGVTQGTEVKARSVAAMVFRFAGVTVEWEACPTSLEQADRQPGCTMSHETQTVQLRLLTSEMVQSAKVGPGTLGLAVIPLQGSGVIASVFPKRAEQASAQRQVDHAVLLGYLMAHELGHLLLGANSHSDRGLMRCPWESAELREAARGSLKFSSNQAESIKAQLRSYAQDGTGGGTESQAVEQPAYWAASGAAVREARR